MSKAGKREYATSSDRNDADAEVTGDGSTEDEPEGIDTRHVVELRAFEWSSKVFDEACEAACVSEDRGHIHSIRPGAVRRGVGDVLRWRRVWPDAGRARGAARLASPRAVVWSVRMQLFTTTLWVTPAGVIGAV